MKPRSIETESNVDLESYCENERKFIPIYPERLQGLRHHDKTVAIEQVYLSGPSEPFGLRLREYADENGAISYEATLKDRGELRQNALSRLEVSTPISESLYHYYKSEETPVIKKLRSEPVDGVVVDFYEDGHMQTESESPEGWREFTSLYGEDFIEVTALPDGDNEMRAHNRYRQLYGHDARPGSPDVCAWDIVDAIVSQANELPSIVHIGGRSGSGKSTVVREVQSRLNATGLASCVLSTDDYHRGKSWLENYNGGEPWSRWDDPIVYDLASMRSDITALLAGQSIARRTINWVDVEPDYGSALEPADIVIIEGIYATSPEIKVADSLVFELQTPLATCIGRRLLRDLKERPQFADPVESLRYMLAEAEPAYRRQREL